MKVLPEQQITVDLLAQLDKVTNDDAIFMKDALVNLVKLHHFIIYYNDEHVCNHCYKPWPCLTVKTIDQALNG